MDPTDPRVGRTASDSVDRSRARRRSGSSSPQPRRPSPADGASKRRGRPEAAPRASAQPSPVRRQVSVHRTAGHGVRIRSPRDWRCVPVIRHAGESRSSDGSALANPQVGPRPRGLRASGASFFGRTAGAIELSRAVVGGRGRSQRRELCQRGCQGVESLRTPQP
jgi:hypothetical protein